MPDIGQVDLPCLKKENIIVIGSENYYDSFWFKMMFMSPGFSVALGMLFPPSWKPADLTTVLYVAEGYSKSELLIIEYLKNKGCEVKKIQAVSDVVNAINIRKKDERGRDYKIQNLAFFCHGLNSRLALNYRGEDDEMEINLNTLPSLKASSFCKDGKIYSYACRTGVSEDDLHMGFSSLKEAKPELSLAQKMADHFNVKVHAFYKRTFFRYTLRKPEDSAEIAKSLKAKRQGNEGKVIAISSEHEALPHKGLADSGWDIGPLETGPIGEGTNDYALWRKRGARALPIVADSPAGLPDRMNIFKPKDKKTKVKPKKANPYQWDQLDKQYRPPSNTKKA